jgi:IMP dehydrogenase
MEGLTFDDVLLLPNESSFPREAVNLATQLHPRIKLKLPILSSPMDTVTESGMAVAMAQAGGLGVIHRNLAVEKQAKMVEHVKKSRVTSHPSELGSAEAGETREASLDTKGRYLVAAAIGAGADMQERVKALVAAGVDMIVVDSGHGHSTYIMDCVRHIKKTYGSKVVIMAGNVATYEGAKALIKAGADVLRVGVGPGSICTCDYRHGCSTGHSTDGSSSCMQRDEGDIRCRRRHPHDGGYGKGSRNRCISGHAWIHVGRSRTVTGR